MTVTRSPMAIDAPERPGPAARRSRLRPRTDVPVDVASWHRAGGAYALPGTRSLVSVGIDVGTTTTQMIFSGLEVKNLAPVSQIPRFEFSKREILYQSPVVFTPLTADRCVDVPQLLAFVDSQYRAAGFERGEVESGAIIITGETSKTRNAKAAVMEIADTLGDFVVATAGPHLEAVIAGRGSGAADWSQAHGARVLNVDIGGGTSNYVVFAGGRVQDTACLNVGGRLIETDAAGKVTRVHEPGRLVCADLFGLAQDPLRLTAAQLARVAERMADLVVEAMSGARSPLADALLMTAPLREVEPFDALFISGGVGGCLYHPELAATPFAFGDIGPLLARALAPRLAGAGRNVREPAQTVRATVIGAGAHTLSLSGSTIWVNAAHLPIKNLPVAHPGAVEPSALHDAWESAVRRLDLDPAVDCYALALPATIEPVYRHIVGASAELARFCAGTARANAHPLVVVSEQDLGKTLGMELQPMIGRRDLAVIDEVRTREGDYIDIGMPLFNGSLVPVTVKSLAFPS